MRTSLPTRAGATRRRLEVSVELTLDPSLSATARLILGALVLDEPGPVVCPTDRELADRHGVSERTIRSALAAGERAGWIRRSTWAELSPALAARVPSGVRKCRRFLVLQWLLSSGEAATLRRKLTAGLPVPAGAELPAPWPEVAVSLACAPVSTSSELRTKEERTFVSPLSPPENATTGDEAWWLARGVGPIQAAKWARLSAATLEEEVQPGFVPPPATWAPKKYTPPPTERMKVEAMVAACLGTDQAAGLDALLLWLATELRDTKPFTRSYWAAKIPAILVSADGFGYVVEVIMAARKKPKPANYLSASLARGQPGAQKPTPGATLECPPGVGARIPSSPQAPENKYTRRVNP